jgi:heme-degrading monooxygenase HmoA
MVIVLIRTRLRPDHDRAAYQALNGTMFELVQRIPGFVSVAGYTGDGEEVGVVRFATLAALRAWREHPEHLVAQERGRAEFYSQYTIEVCDVIRAHDFVVGTDEPSRPPVREP